MSIEALIEANTTALRELTAALLSAGALQNGQASAAAQSSAAVQAVVKAQKEADAKKPENTAGDAGAPPADAAPETLTPRGKPSAPTGASSLPGSTPTLPWAEKSADDYTRLKDAPADLENVRKAILAINSKIGRAQADAVLARFEVQAVTPKADRRGLDEKQYAEFFKLCLDVLAARVDATAAIPEAV